MEKIDWSEISSHAIAWDEAELEALAGASMRGLCHKVRHKIGSDWLHGISTTLDSLAARATNL
jgi:hypothetical protein